MHNSFYDPKSHVGFVELPDYHETLTINEWWDNGAEPIWITAVNQVNARMPNVTCLVSNKVVYGPTRLGPNPKLI